MRIKINKKSKEYLDTLTSRRVDHFLQDLIIRRNQRSTLEEKVVKFFVWIALRIAIRPHHWKDKRKNKEIIVKAYKGIVSRDFVFIPPAFAYYLLMAFMPIIACMVLFFNVWQSQTDFFTKTINKFINVDLGTIIREFSIDNLATNISSSFLLLFTTLWLASGGFAKFVFTESHLYNHKRLGGFWMNRLRGISIVITLAIYFTIGTIIFSSVPLFFNFIGLEESSKIFTFLLWLFNLGIGFIFLYTGFVLLFKFTPRFKLTWRQVHPGAVVSTVPTLLFTVVYFLISKFAFNYSQFGTIAPILTIAAFLFICSYFIYVGLITNAAFYNVHHAKRTISKITISKK